jgi:hypothetical protein
MGNMNLGNLGNLGAPQTLAPQSLSQQNLSQQQQQMLLQGRTQFQQPNQPGQSQSQASNSSPALRNLNPAITQHQLQQQQRLLSLSTNGGGGGNFASATQNMGVGNLNPGGAGNNLAMGGASNQSMHAGQTTGQPQSQQQQQQMSNGDSTMAGMANEQLTSLAKTLADQLLAPPADVSVRGERWL